MAHFFRAVVLGASLLTLCSALSTVHPHRPAKKKRTAVHPGHKPAFVQRLTRFDHAGLESFLQSEAAWDPSSLAPLVGEEGAATLKEMQNNFLEIKESMEGNANYLDGLKNAELEKRKFKVIDTMSKLQRISTREAERRLKAFEEQQKELKERWEQGVKQLKENMAAAFEGGGLGLQFAEKITKLPWFPGSEKKKERKFGEMSAVQMQALKEHRNFQVLHVNGTDYIEDKNEGLDFGKGSETTRSKVLYNHRKQEFHVTGLSNLFNSQYVGPIGVGTTKKPENCVLQANAPVMFISGLDGKATEQERKTCHLEEESQIWVVFDTGSTNIWIASDLCDTPPCTNTGRHSYGHTRSATFLEPDAPAHLDITFGTGELKGPQGIDDVHVGPFTVKKQTFGMVEQELGDVFKEVPFEGILGLAFPEMSANGVTPFFDNVINQKVLSHNEFAFYFNSDDKSGNGIFWGGVDPAFYEGEIKMYKVAQPYYWSLALDKFMIGDQEFHFGDPLANMVQNAAKSPFNPFTPMLNGVAAALKQSQVLPSPKLIIDSGTTYFTAETGMYRKVMDALPAVRCSDVNDKSHPPLKFILKDAEGQAQTLSIPAEEYMVSDEDGDLCEPAFMKIDIPKKYGPGMILGEVFMRNYFTVFDRGNGDSNNAKVGIARAKKGHAVDMQLRTLTKNQDTFKSGHKGIEFLQMSQNQQEPPKFHHRPGMNEGSSELEIGSGHRRFHVNPFMKHIQKEGEKALSAVAHAVEGAVKDAVTDAVKNAAQQK